MARRLFFVVLIAFIVAFSVFALAEGDNNTGSNPAEGLVVEPISSAMPVLVGNDKDAHGCIGSAGYSWCEAKQKCLRVWEENCIVLPLKNRVKDLNVRANVLKQNAVDAINNLRNNAFERIKALRADQIEKLKDFNAVDINNLAKLNKARLARIVDLNAGTIEKIKGISAVALWKISSMKQENRQALLDLNQEFVARIVSFVPGENVGNILDLNSDSLSIVSDFNNEELAAVSQLDRNALKDLLSQQNASLKERLRALVALNDKNIKFLLSRESFLFARENYLDAKQNFLDANLSFQQLREKIKNARAIDLNALREQQRAIAQQVLLNQLNAILNNLESLQAKGIDFGDYNSVIEKLTALQNNLNDENLSREQIVVAAKEIRDLWANGLKTISQERVLTALNNRLESLLEKSTAAYQKAVAKSVELKNVGKDTSKIDAALVVYKQKIDEAIALHAEASSLLSNNDLNKDFVKIRQDIRQASNKLVNSFYLLNRIMFGFSMLANNSQPVEVTTTNVVDENSADSSTTDVVVDENNNIDLNV